jgi:copper chaperone CopZ
MNQITIAIQGMSCGGCVRNVQQALAALPGVRVDAVAVGSAAVSYDPGVTNRDAIVAAIARAGYTAKAA